MKRFTTPNIPIRFNINHSDIEHIDFLFKLDKDMNSQTLFTRKYPDDVGYDEELNLYTIELTADESGRLPEGIIYMDTRVVMNDGKIPATSIAELRVSATLFNSADRCE